MYLVKDYLHKKTNQTIFIRRKYKMHTYSTSEVIRLEKELNDLIQLHGYDKYEHDIITSHYIILDECIIGVGLTKESALRDAIETINRWASE